MSKKRRKGVTIECDVGGRLTIRSLKRRVSKVTVDPIERIAIVNLDEEAVDKLILRLQRIRGGKQNKELRIRLD